MILGDEQLALSELETQGREAGSASSQATEVPLKQNPDDLKSLVRGLKDEAEREAIARTLERTRWNRKEAARRLGISYKALLYKIRRYNIDQH